MTIALEKPLKRVGTSSKCIIVPKEWTKGKNIVGMILFNLDDKHEREIYEEIRKKVVNWQ